MAELPAGTLSKVPEVTLGFWVIKVLATTLGETGGDAVTMSMNLGYAIGSFIFIAIFAVAVVAQIFAKAFHPSLYWFTIIATTTLGTTLADFADRSLGIGYFGGSSILFAALIASLAAWRRSEGSISVNTVATPRVEMFYWVTILFSQTLGTALGDWMADTNGLGYEGGAVVFAIGLAIVAAAYFYLLDKPLDQGGLEISRYVASGILAAIIVALILILPQRAGVHPRAREQKA
jgi:uncharacterized membrane-anchored protein